MLSAYIVNLLIRDEDLIGIVVNNWVNINKLTINPVSFRKQHVIFSCI